MVSRISAQAHKRICETGSAVSSSGIFRSSLAAVTVGLFVSVCFGCASAPDAKPDFKRAQTRQRKINKQKTRQDDQRDRDLVLAQRSKILKAAVANMDTDLETQSGAHVDLDLEAIANQGVSIAAPEPVVRSPVALSPAVPPVALPSKLPSKKSLIPDSISISPEKTGEHFLYSKVLESYAARNSSELQQALGLLLKTYPESVFADNALYMSGLLAFEKSDMRTALQQFDRLLSEYPRSNKAVAALFAKASIEKKAGKTAAAKRSFLQVKQIFPGSPEATRVSVELKLLESASQKHREL